MRYINSVKDTFEEYGLPKLEVVIVNLSKELVSAIENAGIDVPMISMESQLAEPSLLLEFMDMYGIIYSSKFNTEKNFIN